MNDMTPKKLEKNEKLKIEDANLSDERIPRNLILMYGDTPYIQKAGLEWKANQLFGGAGYSVLTEPITMDYEKQIFVFKGTVIVAANNQRFENYGEATIKNTNSMMQKNLLHMAVTRAECRALRMATACGYASYEEVMTMPNADTTVSKVEKVDDGTPATLQQKDIIRQLIKYKSLSDVDKATADEWVSSLTFQEAVSKIQELTKGNK